MSEKNSEDQLSSLVLKILKSNEDLRQQIEPLIQGQEYAQKALAAHGRILLELINTTTEISKNQDSIRKEFDELKGYALDIKHLKMSFSRFEKLENVVISRIVKKIMNDKSNTLTDDEINKFTEYVKNKQDSDLFGILGGMYDELGQFENALLAINKSVELNPANMCGLCIKAQYLQKLKRHNEALEVLDSIKFTKECMSEVLRLKAKSNSSLGNNEEALAQIEQSIKENGNDPYAWSLKGRILRDLNRTIESLGPIEKALEIDPNLFTALFEKGVTLLDLGSEYASQAILTFEKAVSICKEDGSSWHNLGLAYHKLHNDKKALESFNSAIDNGIMNPCTFCMRGISKNRLGDNEGALKDFDKALELGVRKNCGHFYLCRSIVLTHLKRFSESIENGNKAIEYIKADPSTLSDYIKIIAKQVDDYVNIGNLSKANELINEILELTKLGSINLDAHIQNEIAWTYYLMKEYSKGIGFAEDAIKKQPTSAHFDTLACLQAGLEQYTASLENFERAIQNLDGKENLSWNEYINVLEKLGKVEEATKVKERLNRTHAS